MVPPPRHGLIGVYHQVVDYLIDLGDVDIRRPEIIGQMDLA